MVNEPVLRIILITAAYSVYAAFWIRFIMHALIWWRAVARPVAIAGLAPPSSIKAWALSLRDVVLFWRLLKVNPALWFGEWVFHVSFLVVALWHLRYFFISVPEWVWWLQIPGLIAGYVLPLSLIYILIVRRFAAQEKYSSPANMVLLALLLAISSLGLLLATLYRTDVVMVKLFIQGILSFSPAAVPGSILFLLHFSLVLVLIPLLPTHILSAPLVMLEAEKRDLALPRVLHEK
jgi:nitrate reductase gamma subunit